MILKALKTITAALILCIATSTSYAQIGPGDRYFIPVEKQNTPTETTAALKIGIVPIMPPRAITSGYCCMFIIVGVDGKPTNIKAEHCSSKVFKKPSMKSVKGWRFHPALKNGDPVNSRGQTHIVSYYLTDEKGRYLPDPEQQTLVNGKPNYDAERLCRAVKTS